MRTPTLGTIVSLIGVASILGVRDCIKRDEIISNQSHYPISHSIGTPSIGSRSISAAVVTTNYGEVGELKDDAIGIEILFPHFFLGLNYWEDGALSSKCPQSLSYVYWDNNMSDYKGKDGCVLPQFPRIFE